jgi:hypothetical protein
MPLPSGKAPAAWMKSAVTVRVSVRRSRIPPLVTRLACDGARHPEVVPVEVQRLCCVCRLGTRDPLNPIVRNEHGMMATH